MRLFLFILKLLGFLIKTAPEKEKFYIENKWTIELPLDWEEKLLEINFELDNSPILETVFFQLGSDLSIGVYSLNLLKDVQVHKDTEFSKVFKDFYSPKAVSYITLSSDEHEYDRGLHAGGLLRGEESREGEYGDHHEEGW